MVLIYNTYIDEKEIIGIGPLMKKHPADQVLRQLYNEVTIYFTVYLQRYHFVISTDPISERLSHDLVVAEAAKIKEAYKALKGYLLDSYPRTVPIQLEADREPDETAKP